MKIVPAVLFLLPLLAAGGLAAEPPRSGAAPKKALKVHPPVEADQECLDCHGGKGAPAELWEASKHGLGLVKCMVCHGSLGRDFASRPGTRACQGCHAAQVASLPKAKAGACFSCHAPHSLAARKNLTSPHGK